MCQISDLHKLSESDNSRIGIFELCQKPVNVAPVVLYRTRSCKTQVVSSYCRWLAGWLCRVVGSWSAETVGWSWLLSWVRVVLFTWYTLLPGSCEFHIITRHCRCHAGMVNVVTLSDCELCTGWLKIKYPTVEYSISLQPMV